MLGSKVTFVAACCWGMPSFLKARAQNSRGSFSIDCAAVGRIFAEGALPRRFRIKHCVTPAPLCRNARPTTDKTAPATCR